MKYDSAFMPIENNEQVTNTNYDSAFVPIQSQPTTPKPSNSINPWNNNISTELGKGFLKGAGSTLYSGVKSAGAIVGGLAAPALLDTTETMNNRGSNQYQQLLNQALQTKDPAQKDSLLSQARKLQQGIQTRGNVVAGTEKVFNPNLTKTGAAIEQGLVPTNAAQKVGFYGEKVGELILGSKAAGTKIIGDSGATNILDYATKLSNSPKF